MDGDEQWETGGRMEAGLVVKRMLEHGLQRLCRALGIGEEAKRACEVRAQRCRVAVQHVGGPRPNAKLAAVQFRCTVDGAYPLRSGTIRAG